MINDPKPSIWKAWAVTAIFAVPIALAFIAFTHVPAILVLIVAAILSYLAARGVDERVRKKYTQ